MRYRLELLRELRAVKAAIETCEDIWDGGDPDALYEQRCLASAKLVLERAELES